MGKTHRGKGVRNLPSHGRGICPVCKRTRIKLLYNYALPDGKIARVCKNCRNKHSTK